MLETRTRFKEDCDSSGDIVTLDQFLEALETRTRFKEDCDPIASPLLLALSPPGRLETRTRFKEDCDLRNTLLMKRGTQLALCWKPGLASKRIATSSKKRIPPSRNSSVGNQDSLQRGLRHNPSGDVFIVRRHVGNQDSLQRGLRHEGWNCLDGDVNASLETRTRFKEDCDFRRGSSLFLFSLLLLETRTRFKEDCDPMRQ